ncbi:MAG: HAD family phosphatase [Lachnospiraceae bacterium]|jgi:putative hydrolase of the HAD superfamily|nr:HAD family phosphatase [Lachnospiraceae bacterium]
MIKNIIFDIGNVLTWYTWEKHINSFGFSEEVSRRVADATVKSKEWNEFDRGVLNDGEIQDLLVQNDPGVEKEIREMLADLEGLVERADYAIPWIQGLKEKGYHVFYLSNFSWRAKKECSSALDFLPYADGGILSCEEKLIKPQPEIYRRLLEKYHLTARECVFLDDMAVNVEAARAEGLHAIQFTTKEKADMELAKLGVK